jgi:hypothetical protein
MAHTKLHKKHPLNGLENATVVDYYEPTTSQPPDILSTFYLTFNISFVSLSEAIV